MLQTLVNIMLQTLMVWYSLAHIIQQRSLPSRRAQRSTNNSKWQTLNWRTYCYLQHQPQ